MKVRYIFYLKCAYIWGFGLLLLTILLNLYAAVRVLLLLVAFFPIVVMHIITLLSTGVWMKKKAFFLLTILWSIKYVALAIGEGDYLFWQNGIPTLDWLSLILLLIIGVLVSLSFFKRAPFFLERDERKVIMLVGFLGLLLSVCTTAMVCLSVLF